MFGRIRPSVSSYFTMPSFWSGVSSALDVGSRVDDRILWLSPERADELARLADRDAVLGDFTTARQRMTKQTTGRTR